MNFIEKLSCALNEGKQFIFKENNNRYFDNILCEYYMKEQVRERMLKEIGDVYDAYIMGSEK